LTKAERGRCRKREISFPFSDSSNERPTISAWSHFHEMLKLAQKLKQQGRSDSTAAVAARWQLISTASLSARAARLLLITSLADNLLADLCVLGSAASKYH